MKKRRKMTSIAYACFSGILLLCGVVVAVDGSNDCQTYNAKLSSLPDLTHAIVHQSRRHGNLRIVNVTYTTYQRSFYWCQMDVKGFDETIKRYQRFGFNATHWWVEMGCGGWFIVTECKPDNSMSLTDVVGLPENVKSLSMSGQNTENKSPRTHGTGFSTIDEMYKDWPKQGYRFPNSTIMWDILDNATYVDVAQQLGFYNNNSNVPSALFD